MARLWVCQRMMHGVSNLSNYQCQTADVNIEGCIKHPTNGKSRKREREREREREQS